MSRREELKTFSDDEINALVETLIFGTFNDGTWARDYCGDMNGIMPVAFEHKIDLDFENKWCASIVLAYENKWCASIVVNGRLVYAVSDNPLRAVCECFILMKEAKS